MSVRHAVVTGASSGIGRAVAVALHAQGFNVTLAARREHDLHELAGLLSPAHLGVRVIPTDVRDPAARESLLTRARDAFGPIDVLVNNAGVGITRGPWWSEDSTSDVLDVNFVAPVALSRLALPEMLERRRGHIVNVASVAGHVASSALYSGAKFGLRGFTLGLRRELLGTGVHASLVSPGFVRTAMTAQQRFPMPEPEIVARAVLSVLDRPRREVVVPAWYWGLIALEGVTPGLLDAAFRTRRRGERMT